LDKQPADSTLAVLAARLTAAGLTVAIAESAAGGLIAAVLTELPGSSAYFRGSIVAYDGASKTSLLGIPVTLFEEHGSVSAEAALAMAQAAQRLFGVDIGIGETSIAGPGGGTPDKPVGLSFVAVSGAHGPFERKSQLGRDRQANRETIVDLALDCLRAYLDGLSA
jgi:nicotinamide-nucleotide amidase